MGKIEEIEDYYYDQATDKSTFLGRSVTSFWTPWGIKCMDSEYCYRIRNLGKKVTKLITINREKHNDFFLDVWEVYRELPLNKDHKLYDRFAWITNDENPYVVIERTAEYIERKNKIGKAYQLKELRGYVFSYTNPTYVAELGGEDPKALRAEIEGNPHLHKKIKENLLSNLNTYE